MKNFLQASQAEITRTSVYRLKPNLCLFGLGQCKIAQKEEKMPVYQLALLQ